MMHSETSQGMREKFGSRWSVLACVVFALVMSPADGRAAGEAASEAENEPTVTLPPVPEPISIPPAFKPIGKDVELVAPVTRAMSGGMEIPATWPSPEYIKANLATKNRRKEFPPKWRGGRVYGRGKPDEPGAIHPKDAPASGVELLRMLLRREWIPFGLKKKVLLPVYGKDKAPNLSSVRGRYALDGNAIQVGCYRWAACIVIKPDYLKDGVAPIPNAQREKRLDLIRSVCSKFLNDGRAVKGLPWVAVKDKPGKSAKQKGSKTQPSKQEGRVPNDKPEHRHTCFVLDRAKIHEQKLLPDNSLLWSLKYVSTDGRSVCLWFLTNGGRFGPRIWSPDDPWF